jgi:hypothetical protein
MSLSEDSPPIGIRRLAALVAIVTSASCLLLLVPAGASAAFEQVGCFGGTGEKQCNSVPEEAFGEEVQLGGAASLAVNRSGAGGVPAGTVYAVRHPGGQAAVSMYFPTAGGGLEFQETWVVTELEEPYERCGPLLGTKEVGGKMVAENPCAPVQNGGPSKVGVAVDQTTGNVYVANGTASPPKPVVAVYSPDGSAVVTRFGDQVPGEPPVAETPGKVHDLFYGNSIAVDGTGTVYLFDGTFSTFYSRLMVFQPTTPGVFTQYGYAGEVLARAGSAAGYPTTPVLDDAGNLYVLSHGEKRIEEFAPQTPSVYPGPAATPICSYEFGKGEVVSMTVDPASGEVFFFSVKQPKEVRRLGACDQLTGHFTEMEPEPLLPEAIKPSPERGDLYGLAFDPGRVLSTSRPAGALYGVTPDPVPEGGIGTGEPGQSALGYIFGHPAEIPPEVESESVAHVTESTADLLAKVNAKGFATKYVFQYLTNAAYEANPPGDPFAGAAEAPPTGGNIPGAAGATSVAANIAGLIPNTAYRFRVVVTSNCAAGDPQKVCEDVGDAMGFHTYPGEPSGLPDGRAWELVSPTQKHGGQVYPADPAYASCPNECKPGTHVERYPMQAAPDGEAVAFQGSPFGEGGSGGSNSYVAHRTPEGWLTTDPTPSLFSGRSGSGYEAYSTALTQALFEQTGPSLSPSAPEQYANLYSQAIADPTELAPLLSAPSADRPSTGTERLAIRDSGASADLSRAFFAANDALSDEVPGIAPSAPPVSASEFNLYEWIAATGHISLVNVAPGNGSPIAGASFVGQGSAHGTSADGSRVFFQDKSGQVYVRIDASETRRLVDPGSFVAASADGTKALLKDGCLYDVADATCLDLTAGAGGFVGLSGQSEDLSHIYFIDTAVLPGAGESTDGHSAQGGENNLYAWSSGTIHFVATLADGDGGGSGFEGVNDWAAAAVIRSAQASPAGRFLAFASRRSLTGHQNVGLCAARTNAQSEVETIDGPCAEVYLYDSQTEKLSCPSCNPAGAAPRGRSLIPRLKAGDSSPLSQSRFLLDNGRLYFDSQDSLLPADTNDGVEDVYQWEPQGLGSCARGEGCVSLISAGRSGVDSNFLAVDESGKNVFFTTRDPLVKQDTDELIDLYDAREGGGILAEGELDGACQGEACLPAPVSVPTGASIGSAVFTGPGDLVSPLSSAVVKKGNAVAQTRAQKLARALKACHKLGKSKRRKRCEATARKRYSRKAKGTTKLKPKGSSKGGKRS